MSLEDFTTDDLVREIREAIMCPLPNSEGKAQRHDMSDPYRRWGWAYGRPVRKTYRKCVRCGYVARILRR